MKNFGILLILFVAASASLGQVAGNRVYGEYSNNLRSPERANRDLRAGNYSGYSVEANVLVNVKPDAFVAVFGFERLGSTSESSNAQVNEVFDALIKDLSAVGISREDVFIDFITQSTTIVDQSSRAFQTRKTISIKYKDRKLFEKIVSIAASRSIFDLVKVDYVVSDQSRVKAQLFDECASIIKAKQTKYVNTFGVLLEPKGLANENYDAFYPGERYKGYQKTFYYEPIETKGFDKIINPITLEPTVQFTLYLRMDYDAEPKKNEINK